MTRTTHKRSLTWLACWIILSGLWFLFVGTISWLEAIVGLFNAALITVILTLVVKQDFAHFQPRLIWLLAALRLPFEVLRDSGIALMVLVRLLQRQDVRGSFKVVHLKAAGTNGRASARRALVATLVSTPPNSIVIGFDEEQNTMLMHELQPQEQLPALAKQLGATE